MADGATFTLSLVDKVTGAANNITGSFKAILASAVNAAGGPEKVLGALEAIGKAKEALSAVLQVLGPIGDMASQVGSALVTMAETAAAAIVALGVAIAGATIALAAFAIKAGEAKQAMLATFSALTGGEAQGAATLKMLDSLGDSIGMTREQLGPYATKLLEAGVAGNKLEASLRAVAAANAMIEGSGEKVTSLLAKLNEQGVKGSKIRFSPTMLVGTGVSEEELLKALGMTPKMFELAKKKGTLTGGQIADAIVKALGAKGAGPLADQANRIEAIWLKFKESIAKLFDDVTSSPGYKEFVGTLRKFFSFGTAATGQLKSTITSMFSSLFSWAAKVLPMVKLGIERIVIAVLKAYIAVRLWYKEGGKKDLVNNWNALVQAVKPLIPILVNAAKVAVAFLFIAAKFHSIGSAITQGLANGITAGIPKVTGAIKGLGQAAIAALKGALSIASPSKEFAKLGGFTAAGFTAGVRGGTGGVKAASAGMAGEAIRGAAGAKGAPGKSGGAAKGGAPITFAPGSIVVQAGSASNPQDLSEIILTTVLERVRKAQGV